MARQRTAWWTVAVLACSCGGSVTGGADGDVGADVAPSVDDAVEAAAEAPLDADAAAPDARSDAGRDVFIADDGDDDAGATGRFGAPEHSVATFYPATGGGNCSFDPTPDDLRVVAIDTAEYAAGAVCGECVAITGPRGNTITVRIVDRCPGCEVGHLDLSPQAFDLLAPMSAGRIAITWQPTACEVTGNLGYFFQDGANAIYAPIQVRNARLPIRAVEVRRGSAWVALARRSDNYFVGASLGAGPYTLRVTAVGGQQVTDTGIALDPGHTVRGANQFR